MSTRLAVAETGSGVHWQQTIGASTFLGGSSVTAAEISAGTVNQSCVGANAVGTAELSALGVTEAKLAANAVTGAKISAGTVTNADLSNGCSYFPMHFGFGKVDAGLATTTLLGRAPLPIAASLAKAAVYARNAPVAGKVKFWVKNAANNNLLADTSLVPTSVNLISGAVQSAGQGAQNIDVKVWTSTTTSCLHAQFVLLWKMPLTNP